MRRVRIFDPVKNLKRQAGAELLIEDLNGSQIFCQKIFDIVVKAGYGNVLRHAQSPLFKKLHQNTGNVVAGADKSVRHAGKGGKERIDFLAVGVNPKRCGQAKRRIRCFSGIHQCLAEALIAFAVGLCVADITHEARKSASFLEKMGGNIADAVPALHQEKIAVQFIRGYEGGSVQEHFGNLCLCEQTQKTFVVHVQNNDAVDASVCKCGREKIRFIRRSRKIRVNEIDIVC